MTSLKPVIRPSSFFRVALCPGSATLEAGAPYEPSENAERGTRLHELVAWEVAGIPLSAKTIKLATDEEKALAAQWCLDLANALPDPVWVEQRVSLEWLGEGITGKPDYFGIDDDGKLIIPDLKTGRGPDLRPKNAWQLRLYAITLLKITMVPSKLLRLIFFVPETDFPWREDEVEEKEVWAWEQEALRIKDLALSDNPPYKATVEGCKYCKARTFCPTLRETAMKMIEFAQPGMKLQEAFERMTPEVRSDTWEQLKLAEGWIKDAQLEAVKAAGKMIFTGYERKPTKIDKRWIDKDVRSRRGTLKTLAREFDLRPGTVDDIDTISPAAALKLFPAKAEDKIKSLYEDKPSKDTLKKVKT